MTARPLALASTALVALAGWGCGDDQERGSRVVTDLRGAIEREATGRMSAPLRVDEYARFGWDRLVVDGPYSDVGYRLIFRDGDEVVARGTGQVGANLDCFANRSRGVVREDARFRVLTHKYRTGDIYRVAVPDWPGRRGQVAARQCLAAHGPFD